VKPDKKEKKKITGKKSRGLEEPNSRDKKKKGGNIEIRAARGQKLPRRWKKCELMGPGQREKTEF